MKYIRINPRKRWDYSKVMRILRKYAARSCFEWPNLIQEVKAIYGEHEKRGRKKAKRKTEMSFFEDYFGFFK